MSKYEIDKFVKHQVYFSATIRPIRDPLFLPIEFFLQSKIICFAKMKQKHAFVPQVVLLDIRPNHINWMKNPCFVKQMCWNYVFGEFT